MRQITVQQAHSLIVGKDEVHCMMTNPILEPGLMIVGWHKVYDSAVEAIETADELYLLTDREAFCSHRLLCVKPKGRYPDERVYMQV